MVDDEGETLEQDEGLPECGLLQFHGLPFTRHHAYALSSVNSVMIMFSNRNYQLIFKI
jgi:hypothetical protein